MIYWASTISIKRASGFHDSINKHIIRDAKSNHACSFHVVHAAFVAYCPCQPNLSVRHIQIEIRASGETPAFLYEGSGEIISSPTPKGMNGVSHERVIRRG